MKVVHSLWSRPWGKANPRNGVLVGWPTPLHLWASWAYSCLVSRHNYGRIELVADSVAARVLVDDLELPYDHVRTDLDDLDVDPRLWMAGKLRAYELQDEPFLHIDGDAYLTRRLPDEYHRAPLVVQTTEHNTRDMTGYAAHRFVKYMGYKVDGWDAFYRDSRAFNVGIFGGTAVDEIKGYARQASRMLTDPDNRVGWDLIRQAGDKTFWTANTVVEQMGAYAYFNSHKVSALPLLFDHEWRDRVQVGKDRGFTHMMSARFVRESADRVIVRLMSEYPEYMERVERFVGARREAGMRVYDVEIAGAAMAGKYRVERAKADGSVWAGQSAAGSVYVSREGEAWRMVATTPDASQVVTLDAAGGGDVMPTAWSGADGVGVTVTAARAAAVRVEPGHKGIQTTPHINKGCGACSRAKRPGGK